MQNTSKSLRITVLPTLLCLIVGGWNKQGVDISFLTTGFSLSGGVVIK